MASPRLSFPCFPPASPPSAPKSGEADREQSSNEGPGAPIMAKIMKRTVDALEAHADHNVFAWDTELRGFGLRVKASEVKTFLIQYRNAESRFGRAVDAEGRRSHRSRRRSRKDRWTHPPAS